VIAKLHYLNEMDTCAVLPEWTQWYIKTGSLIGSLEKSKDRLVLGISIPALPYAVVMTCLGIIHCRSSLPVERNDPKKYFEFLKKFNEKTSVSFLITDRKGVIKRRDGILDGFGKEGDREYASVLYLENEGMRKAVKTKCWKRFYVNESRQVMITDAEVDITSPHRKGSTVVNNYDFLSHFLSKGDIFNFATASRLDCLMVGSKNRLLNEIESDFAVSNSGGNFIRGSLKDIIRPRNHYSYGQSYRSLCHSGNSKKHPDSGDAEPFSVVFESLRGYEKWHHRFKNAHHIVLLDRGDNLSVNVAIDLNRRYYRRCNASSMFGLNVPAVPQGIEVISFRERCDA
jgi:hypothetical protein